jgi:peptide/nickel transport system substrate-binding protein
MSVISRRFILGVTAIAFSAGLAPAFAQAQRPVLTLGVQGSPRTLEPVMDNSNVLWRIGYNMFDTLIAVDYKDGGKLIPSLATGWKRLSPTELEFTLREGVKFHNGETMTAEDVAFSLGVERAFGEKAPGRPLIRAFLGTIDKVEATGPLTVKVTTKQPDPLIEARLAGWTAQIISKKAYLAAPSFQEWQLAPVGTGPYKVKLFKDGDRVTLEAHDQHFRGAPPAQEIIFKVMPELASRVSALRAGDVDMITEVTVDAAKEIERLSGLEVAGGPIQNLRVLIFDKNNPVLANPKVRQALSLAIDRQAIVASLYEGRTSVPRGHQHASYGPMFLADWPMPAHDPAKARALLAEAGYKGEVIPYRLLSNYYTLQNATAQAMVEMWKAVGLNVELQFRENWQQVLAAEGRGIRDWSNSVLWQDPVGVLVRLYGPRGPLQVTYKEFSNETFNKAADTLETSLDLATRRDAFRTMLKVYDETDPPGTVLHDLVMLYGKKKTFKWTAYPVEYMDFGPGNLQFLTQ